MKELADMTYDEIVKHSALVAEVLRCKAYGEGYEQGRFDEKVERDHPREANECHNDVS